MLLFCLLCRSLGHSFLYKCKDVLNVNHISKSYFLHRIASNAHKILNLFDLHIFRSKKNVLDVDLPSLIYIYKDDTGKLNVSTEDRFMVTDRF